MKVTDGENGIEYKVTLATSILVSTASWSSNNGYSGALTGNPKGIRGHWAKGATAHQQRYPNLAVQYCMPEVW
jgi:hypothetical protein